MKCKGKNELECFQFNEDPATWDDWPKWFIKNIVYGVVTTHYDYNRNLPGFALNDYKGNKILIVHGDFIVKDEFRMLHDYCISHFNMIYDTVEDEC